MSVSVGDVRRLFCQAVLSRGIMSEKLARATWVKCSSIVTDIDQEIYVPNVNEQKSWEDFIKIVNDSVDDLDFEFKLFQDELSGEKMYGLINRKDDEVAQVATDYTPGEIAFFKAIVEQIMLASNESYSVSSLAALREVRELKPKSNMTNTQAESVLNSFVAKGWLLKSKKGRFSLSTRTIMELGGYLKNTYPDEFLECLICKDMVTKGVACPAANCQVRLHFHCFVNQRRTRSTCSVCQENWGGEAKDMVPVGEAAARGDERRRRRRTNDSEEEEDEDDEDPESSQAPTKTQPKRSQKARTSKGKAVKKEKDDDDDDDEGEEDQLEDDDSPPPTAPNRRTRRR
ncbi:Nse1 non-SMC component of SMC5-6 complex-domain-containing protein [Mycena floridula]|nr:Nse1 non-SMC component of SMC5-6 complex-domain-containing protein [Mycena floridula]